MATHEQTTRRPKQAHELPTQGYHGRASAGARNGHTLADLSTQDQGQILRLLDHESQLREIGMLIDKTRTRLDGAVLAQDLKAIVSLKNQANWITKVASELKFSELRLDALELTRRCERQTGLGIRGAQERGEVMKRTRTKRGLRVKEYATNAELSGEKGNNGIYAMTDGVSDEMFEEVLAEARAENNLSRNNVALKCWHRVHPKRRKRTYPSKAGQDSRPLSLEELCELVVAMQENYRLMVLLAACCGIRFAQLSELRRRDVDLDEGVIRVRRMVLSRFQNKVVVLSVDNPRAPPFDATIPGPLITVVQQHLKKFVDPDMDALLFPAATHGGHMAVSSMQNHFYRAREVLNRPDLRFEDLRHLQLPVSRASDAALAELVNKLDAPPPPPRRVRKTAAARKVMEDLVNTTNSLAFITAETDPEEVELENHREDIADTMRAMSKITKFLNRVKEQQ